MRYRASEKLEIIRLVEQSHLGVGSNFGQAGHDRRPPFIAGTIAFWPFGDAGLEDRNSSARARVWNRILG